MQCYYCGQEMPASERVCPGCGRAPSKLIYAPFCGAAGGIAGSLLGFTLFGNLPIALLLGLVGVLAGELGGRLFLRTKESKSIGN